MTKKEMMNRIEELKAEKGILRLDGINWNCDKNTLQSTINCLECSDEKMDEYMVVFKLKYPHSYEKIINNGNWKTHPFNRLYVYSSAKSILAV